MEDTPFAKELSTDLANFEKVQAEEIHSLDQVPDLSQQKLMNVYIDKEGNYYCDLTPKDPGDSLLPFPAKNLKDTLASKPGVIVDKESVVKALAKYGNGENSMYGNTGISMM